jgi:hypothetical protein
MRFSRGLLLLFATAGVVGVVGVGGAWAAPSSGHPFEIVPGSCDF